MQFSKKYLIEAEQYKKRTLTACKRLANNFRHPINKIFFMPDHDPLCKIYWKYVNNEGVTCHGCFLTDEFGKPVCIKFKKYKRAFFAMYNKIMFFDEKHRNEKKQYLYFRCVVAKPCNEMIEYAKFFEARITELIQMPAWRFHPKSMYYFKYKWNI